MKATTAGKEVSRKFFSRFLFNHLPLDVGWEESLRRGRKSGNLVTTRSYNIRVLNKFTFPPSAIPESYLRFEDLK